MAAPSEIRLFISSTFRDMQEEREHLIRKIFPEIRSICRQRGIVFTEVDLRWGLTDKDVLLGQVIRTCLEEIDRCRPYFIGLVGERYGWAPPLHEFYKDPDLFTRWPWLEDAAMENSSITDIEFRHGALNDPESAKHARFYFRRRRRSIGEDDNRGDDSSARLGDLKSRVRDAGLSVEEYRDFHSLGEIIYDELIEIIERDFSDSAPPAPLDEERSRHLAFATSRRRAYIPNPRYLKRLDDWLSDGEAEPLILYAESGSGKSSLLAFWCESLRRRQSDLHIIEHYVGIGAGDSDHLGIIRHLVEEIQERYDRPEDVPVTPQQLEQQFANWLGFNMGKPMLVVIDGINQLGGRADYLHWLPESMPEGVRLVISSTVEGTLVDLRGRNWNELGMQPLDVDERSAVIVRFLAEYRKALSSEQITLIADDAKSAHPLFLRTLLEELRLHGLHEHLDRTISSLLGTTGTEDLFQKVLERLEDDYGTRSVREVFGLLWASRNGLTEEEIEEITGISRLKLSTMLLGLDYHLIRRDGILSFFHDYLRRAVRKRYLHEASAPAAIHGRLAEHFETALTYALESGEPLDRRDALEILHQLDMLAENDRRATTLAQIPILLSLHSRQDRYELLRHWADLGGAYDVAHLYREGLERWKDTQRLAPTSNEVAIVHIRVARLLEEIGDWKGAVEQHRMIQELADADEKVRADSLVRMGGVLRLQEKFDEAVDALERGRKLHEERGDRNGMAGAIGVLGVIAYRRGNFDEATRLLERARDIFEEVGNEFEKSNAIANFGTVLFSQGKFDQAMEAFRRSTDYFLGIGDRQHATTGLTNIANVYFEWGEPDKALECFEECAAIHRGIGNWGELAFTLRNVGIMYHHRDDPDGAIASLAEAVELCRRIGNDSLLARTLTFMGGIAVQWHRFDDGFASLLEGLDVGRKVGSPFLLSFQLREMCHSVMTFLEHAAHSTNAMPDYLPDLFPEVNQESWRADMLGIARRLSREADELEDHSPDGVRPWEIDVVKARILTAEGEHDDAISLLSDLLETHDHVEALAEIHYRLSLVHSGENSDRHHDEALRLYTELRESMNMREFRLRVEQLRAPRRQNGTDV